MGPMRKNKEMMMKKKKKKKTITRTTNSMTSTKKIRRRGNRKYNKLLFKIIFSKTNYLTRFDQSMKLAVKLILL